MLRRLAINDYNRARRRALWRQIGAWLTGRNNQLLPFDAVRQALPSRTQHYIGQQTVRLENIIGSEGRYRDFDRAFLPRQSEINQRWINIGEARYRDIELPPVELYKIGEVYFVKDGNHRISVARERGQTFIDAYVTEIEVPIPVHADVSINELHAQRDYIDFMQQVELRRLRPDADLRLSQGSEYSRLHEHINSHRYFVSETAGVEVPYAHAVRSWYDTVYLPLVAALEAEALPDAFPGLTRTDLYLWVSEYKWLRREAYQSGTPTYEAEERLLAVYNHPTLRRLLNNLNGARWIDGLILTQEHATFARKSELTQSRPEADIRVTLPGKIDELLDHISVHRYYLGEQRHADVSFPDAAISWYDNVYTPLLAIIDEQSLLAEFPQRTATDFYLWVMDHRVTVSDLMQPANA